MLRLYNNNFENIIQHITNSNEYIYIDCNKLNNYSIPHMGRVDYKCLEHAMLPFIMNNIEINQQTYTYNSDKTPANELVQICTAINSTFEISNDDQLNIIRVFTDQPAEVITRIDTDIYKDIPDEINSLYQHCWELHKERNNLDFDPYITVLVSRAKHIILMISNTDDPVQASEMFLTIGLIPRLYEDYLDKFCKSELDYFEKLVARSQVKRINNSEIAELFKTMCVSNKYKTSLKSRSIELLSEDIVTTKRMNIGYQVDDAKSNAEGYLHRYQEALNILYKLQKDMDMLNNHTDEYLETYKMALGMEEVYNAKVSSPYIYLKIASTVKFFETDEVECVINNMDNNNAAKQIYKDLFIDQKYSLRVMSYFKYRFDGNNQQTDVIAGTLYSNDLYENNCLYNPHHQYFNCLGDYKPKLIDAQAKQDILMFVNIAIASVKSLNFRDGAVIGRFTSNINDNFRSYIEGTSNDNVIKFMETKCLIDKNGEEFSLADIYIHQQATQPEENVEENVEEVVEEVIEQEPIELEVEDTL